MLDPAVYARVFENHAEGAQIIEELAQLFRHRPPIVKGGIDAILSTYRSQGNAEVIDFIINRINRARGIDANERDDDE